MRAVLSVVAACLACAALAACGASGSSASSDRRQIESMFSSVDRAMANGDYAAACGHFSSHQWGAIVAGAKRAGLNVSTCPAALTAVIKATGMSRAQLAQTFGSMGTPRMQSVSVHGDQATVTYTTKAAGRAYTETDALVREDGQWKADRIIKRTR